MNSSQCPKCLKSDMTSSVQAAIKGDISVSYTQGSTVSWTSNETSTSWFTTTNVGRLAQSMQYPGKPFSGRVLFVLMLWGFLISDVIYAFTNFQFPDNPEIANQIFMGLIFLVISLPFAALSGMFYGAIAYVVIALFTIPSRIAWKKKERFLLTSRYCYRDNVIFSGASAHRPDIFISKLFQADDI